MALLLLPDGKGETVFPKDMGRGFSLEELYALIGCECIEVVNLRDGFRLVVDEDGLRKELPLNPSATMAYQNATGIRSKIVGNALLVGRKEIQ